MSRRPLACAAAIAALALPAAAAAMPGMAGRAGAADRVSIGFDAFAPQHTDVVAGDTVSWSNDSARRHTVTADDGSFDSGGVAPGDGYARTFAAPGSFAYHCTLHPYMTGVVDVHELLLAAQPTPAAPGRPFPLRGRVAPGLAQTVEIQADGGSGFTDVASASVADDGSFAATITPSTTASYRAVAGAATSDPIQLVVLDHTVTVSTSRHGTTWNVRAGVTPSAPGQTVVLQLRLRDRFGWWPVATGKLGRSSQATLRTRLRHRVPARVLLTLPDAATPLAFSPTVELGGK